MKLSPFCHIARSMTVTAGRTEVVYVRVRGIFGISRVRTRIATMAMIKFENYSNKYSCVRMERGPGRWPVVAGRFGRKIVNVDFINAR